jgi:hypothetical protein
MRQDAHRGPDRRRRPGTVIAAIVQVLESASGPMRGCEIYVAVERLLGEPVGRSSVKNALRDGDGTRVVRVGPGLYRLNQRL